MFLIYVDDIISDIECEILLLFADDTSVLEPVSDPRTSIVKLNRDLGQTIAFNPTRTKFLIFQKSENCV